MPRGRVAQRLFLGMEETVTGSLVTRFLEVQATEHASIARDSHMEIRLRNGRSVVVEQGFDAEQVRALLVVAEAAE